jgi:hypothetical protein
MMEYAMNRKTLAIAAAAAVVALGLGTAAASAHGWREGGPGYGFGHGPMMGPGMMGGYGYGHARGYGAGPCGAEARTPDKPMTGADVGRLLERRLDRWNNPNLKLGEVKEGDKTITGEIVTKDGSLVRRLTFDRDTWRVTDME